MVPSSAFAVDSTSKNEIGRLGRVTGQVDVRLPRKTRFLPAEPAADFFLQETLLTHGGKSEATLDLHSGASIRVLGDSRIVIEADANHDDSIYFSILSGEVELLKAAPAGKLHFMRDGREIELKVGRKISLVPVLGARAASEKDHLGLVIATAADEARAHSGAGGSSNPGNLPAPGGLSTSSGIEASPSPAPTSSAQPAEDRGGKHGPRFTLGNDQINRQIKSQTSFFQRCYLNYLNRSPAAPAGAPSATPSRAMTVSSKSPEAADLNARSHPPSMPTSASTPMPTSMAAKQVPVGTGPNGALVVVLGFAIQSSGRVNHSRIVRSDVHDETLEKCLTEVLERTSFGSFTGATIDVSEYPVMLN